VRLSDTWHSIRNRPFPIRGLLEQNFYLYRFFLKYWAWPLSILQYCRPLAKKVIIVNQRGPRHKKVTEGPEWLRYATASTTVTPCCILHIVSFSDCSQYERCGWWLDAWIWSHHTNPYSRCIASHVLAGQWRHGQSLCEQRVPWT